MKKGTFIEKYRKQFNAQKGHFFDKNKLFIIEIEHFVGKMGFSGEKTALRAKNGILVKGHFFTGGEVGVLDAPLWGMERVAPYL